MFATLVRAEEEKPGAPREERKEAAGREHRKAEETAAAARAEIEQHLKAVMDEAQKLEAAGKKDAAEALRKQAKERAHQALVTDNEPFKPSQDREWLGSRRSLAWP